MLACTRLLEWLRIDDVVGAIPVHVGAGVWGTIAVALFADLEVLNVAEHGATTETLDLLSVMDSQAKTGDLSLRVPVEPFTEIGQIAELYNRVMKTLQRTTHELKRNVSDLERSNTDLRQFAYAASHDMRRHQ